MTFNVLEDISIETPEGIITLSPGQVIRLSKEEAFPLIENGMIAPSGKVDYRVYSGILQAYLRVVADTEEMKALRSEGITEAVYTYQEITEIKKLNREDLKDIHKVKEVFEDSKIEKIIKRSNKKIFVNEM